MRRIKKRIAVGLLIFSVGLLAGWGKAAVELLNDTLLIDLDKAIKEAPIGKQGNTFTIKESEAEREAIVDNQTVNASKKKIPVSPEKKKERYIIKIKDTTITYKNSRYTADTLKEKLIRDCSNGAASIYLQDDYAEAHVYRNVLAILEQLEETIGLEYQAE